jgi:hypothetical protein
MDRSALKQAEERAQEQAAMLDLASMRSWCDPTIISSSGTGEPNDFTIDRRRSTRKRGGGLLRTDDNPFNAAFTPRSKTASGAEK